MKILYIASDTIWGGANVALYNLIDILRKEGNEIRVILPSSKGRLYSELKKINIQVYSFYYELTIKPNSRYFVIRTLKRMLLIPNRIIVQNRINSIISNYRPDIVHTNVGPLDYALDICKKKSIPHIWHLREYQDLDFGLSFYRGKDAFEKIIHSDGNFNIAITRGVFSHWHLNKDKDTVIYDGVFDSGSVKIHDNSKKGNYFLFVGRIDSAKQPDLAIKAFCDFSNINNHYKLLLAGPSLDPVYLDYCKKIIRDNHMEDRIEFLGQRKDVYQLMANAIALIVPSRFEGFGFITAEAMLNGCLVIGRDTAGTKEQFDNGLSSTGQEIGLRFSTISELITCMQRSISEDLSHTIALARSVVIENYSSKKSAEKVFDYYKRIINNDQRN